MPEIQFPVNSRDYTTFSLLDKERDLAQNKNYLCELSYLSSLDVIGEEAADFLQGQLTCDVRDVSPQLMRQGISCDLKGRILSLMDIIHWQGIHLILADDILEKLQLSLAKTALLSRVKLQKNSTIKIFGFILNNTDDLIPCALPTDCFQVSYSDAYCCYRLSHHRYIILTHHEHSSTMCDPFIAAEQYKGSLIWHEQQLKDGQVEIYKDSRGLFLPHRLDLHKTPRISFDKGCYKGQEIIARTHYRAKQKHTLAQFIITTTELLNSGQRLLNPDTGAEIGELVDFCPIGENTYLIATSVIFDCPVLCVLEGQQQSIHLKPL